MTTHTPLRCANSGMVKSGSTIVLLNPGSYPSFSNYGNQTWIWNGSNGLADWTQLNSNLVTSTGPLGPAVNSVKLSGRLGCAMAFDGANVMMYGGQGSSNLSGVFGDTWIFNGTTWALQSPTTSPFGRYNAKATYLAGTGAIMFGGERLGEIVNETWIWNGTTWSQVTVSNGAGPAARTYHCMGASTTTVLLFGGRGTNSQFNDTWTFNGTTWTRLNLSSTNSPSARDGACMTYDSEFSKWVMFGGQNSNSLLKETWTFNGTTWTQVPMASGTGPSARINAHIAFDPARGTTIMFGGITAKHASIPSNETWEFNSQIGIWTQL